MPSPPPAGRPLPVGLSAGARVPASSANLGAGFDSLAVALSMYDQVEAAVTAEGLAISVTGEDAESLVYDEGHLVVRAIRRGLAVRGRTALGLSVRCHNVVPHARGLGSSAAAVVAGLAVAQALVAKAEGQVDFLDSAELVQLAGEFEGHPDNGAASVLGGAVASWTEDGERSRPSAVGARYRAARIPISPQVSPVIFIPKTRGLTHVSRGLLPALVTREDAVANLSRSALMVLALSSDPTLLYPASADRLHQPHRAAEQSETADLVRRLRDGGVAAMVSGAGPSVLALISTDEERRVCEHVRAEGEWERREVAIAEGVQAW